MFLSDDDMVECPYNKTHCMLRKRLQSHLLKCRLSYPDVELRKCPFNITHLIPEPEFTHHATNCPDRKLITQYKYDAPEPKEEEGPKHAPIECDEDWDDTDVNDYNPQLYLERANIIRKPDGANPSERKLFIKKERKRLGDGDDSSEDESKNSTSFSVYDGHRNDGNDDNDVIEKASHGRRSDSPTSYRKESWSRNSGTKHSTSPSTSKEHSRSQANKYKRNRSRSPVGFNKSYRDNSPPRRRSPDYSRHYSPPFNSVGQNFYSYNSDQDPYYNGDGGNANNSSYSGRDPFYSNANQFQPYDGNAATDPTIPQTPPPPMISYPAPRTHFTSKTKIPPSDF